MTKIKICGLQRSEDVLAVNASPPDYVGFVFAPSPRKITLKQASVLKGLLDPHIQVVGVFTNECPTQIEHIYKEGLIDIIQLHGDETEAYTQQLKNKLGSPIIRAVRVRSKKQLLAAQEITGDYLLFDGYKKGIYGGSGTSFDHALIPLLHRPFFLAGGIGVESIHDVKRQSAPFCIDISSGVETHGKKDPRKIQAAVNAVRA